MSRKKENNCGGKTERASGVKGIIREDGKVIQNNIPSRCFLGTVAQ